MKQERSNIKQIKDSISWLFAEKIMPRLRAEWMTSSGDVILEFLKDSGAAHNKQGITNNLHYRNVDVSYTTLNRRIPKLQDAELIEPIPGQGKYYEITEKGGAYLRGDGDLRDEPEPDA